MNLGKLENGASAAWFDESAIGRFLYSLYLSPDVGFDAIYRTMREGQKNTPALTSVFSFGAALRPTLGDAGKAKLDELLTQINVQAGPELDPWGTQTRFLTPTNINPAVFPIYVPLTLGQSATSCSTTQFGAGNKLGNYSHLRVTVPSPGKYRMDLKSEAEYQGKLYGFGKEMPYLTGSDDGLVFEFSVPGDYVFDVAPGPFTDKSTAPGSAPQCVTVSMQAVNQ